MRVPEGSLGVFFSFLFLFPIHCSLLATVLDVNDSESAMQLPNMWGLGRREHHHTQQVQNI